MVYPFSSANRTVNQNQIDYSVRGGVPNPTLKNSTVASVPSHGTNVPLWKIDMGKEANFTVQIDGITKPNMKHSKWGQFLPVKSLNYVPVSIETMKLKAGIFADLPIPSGRKIGRVDLEIQDTEDHYFENQFFAWYNQMIPDSRGYVGYFEDFVKKLTYTEFNNKGQTVKTYYMEVIMDGDLKVTRTYDNNGLKIFSVSLLIVGIITSNNNPYSGGGTGTDTGNSLDPRSVSAKIIKYGN